MKFIPSVGHEINMVGRLYAKVLNDRIIGTGITTSQLAVINRLLIHEELTQTEICEQLSFKASSISKTIDSMEKTGWIKRSVAEYDKREKKVALTDKTKKHLTEWIPIIKNFEKEALTNISAEDIDVFGRVLGKIFSNLKILQE